MARVKIEDVVDHLSYEFRRALTDTIKKEIPDAEFNERQVFRTFKRNVYRKCNVWENVPDQYVEVD